MELGRSTNVSELHDGRRRSQVYQGRGVQMIDLRFTDLPGTWQHFSVPPSAADADAMSEGIGFDGSSIRRIQEIQESDMLVVPDATTAFLDPFT